jgi:hypothetical protein
LYFHSTYAHLWQNLLYLYASVYISLMNDLVQVETCRRDVTNDYLLMTVQFVESILCSTQQQPKQNAPQDFVHNNINYWRPRAQCSTVCSGKYCCEAVKAGSATKCSTLAKHGNSSEHALCRPKICCHYLCLRKKHGQIKGILHNSNTVFAKMSDVCIINYLKALNSAHWQKHYLHVRNFIPHQEFITQKNENASLCSVPNCKTKRPLTKVYLKK